MVVLAATAVVTAKAALVTAAIMNFWFANFHEWSAHKEMIVALLFSLALLVQIAATAPPAANAWGTGVTLLIRVTVMLSKLELTPVYSLATKRLVDYTADSTAGHH